MADAALYAAKSAICSHCSFASGNDREIQNGTCPRCCSSMKQDRNRVEVLNANS